MLHQDFQDGEAIAYSPQNLHKARTVALGHVLLSSLR